MTIVVMKPKTNSCLFSMQCVSGFTMKPLCMYSKKESICLSVWIPGRAASLFFLSLLLSHAVKLNSAVSFRCCKSQCFSVILHFQTIIHPLPYHPHLILVTRALIQVSNCSASPQAPCCLPLLGLCFAM